MLFDGFDVLFNIVFALIFCSVFIILAYGIITSITTWNKNNHSPQLNVSARVVAKRTEVSHHQHPNNGDISGSHGYSTTSSTSYYVTFEVDSGDRIEFSMSGSEYGMLIEGDAGTLKQKLGCIRIVDLSANKDIRAIKNKQFLTELFNTMYSEWTVPKFNKKNK